LVPIRIDESPKLNNSSFMMGYLILAHCAGFEPEGFKSCQIYNLTGCSRCYNW